MAKKLYDFGELPASAYDCVGSEHDAQNDCRCLTCDPGAFSASAQCNTWLTSLEPQHRASAALFLKREVSLHKLQQERDLLVLRYGHLLTIPTVFWADRSWFEDPEKELNDQIRILDAAHESAEAADPIGRRAEISDRMRREGVRQFLASGMTHNSYARQASSEYFYNPKTMARLSDRQIVRVLHDIAPSLSPQSK